MRIHLKHLNKFKDRHGKWHVLLRIPGCKSVALHEPIGSPAFMTEYEAGVKTATDAYMAEHGDLPDAVKPKTEKGKKAVQAVRKGGAEDRTIKALGKLYDDLIVKPISNEGTKKKKRLTLDAIVREHGHRSAVLLEFVHVAKMHADMADKPGAANNRLRILSEMMDLAGPDRLKWRTGNPCAKVSYYKGGHHATWTMEQLDAFEKRWALGTPERTAYEIMAWTSVRISDAFLLRWSQYRELPAEKRTDDIWGWIIVSQKKADDENQDRTLNIPVPPELAEALAAWRDALRSTERKIPGLGLGDSTILVTQHGKTFSQGSISKWFAEKIAAAGLPEKCVAHGLRKSAARGMAEGMASTKAIQAVTGHRNLKEIELYTEAADQKRLAPAGVRALRSYRKGEGG